jgi:hypothetical protein
MAGGGDVAPVQPWDLASLIGAIVLLSTVLMFAWPPSHNVELDGDRTGLSEIGVGMLGSADIIEISLKNATACERDNISCTGAVIHILSSNGDEIVNHRLTPGGSFTSERYDEGPVTVEISGEGSYRVTIEVHRQLPLEFLPAVAGIILLAWGEWRRRQ